MAWSSSYTSTSTACPRPGRRPIASKATRPFGAGLGARYPHYLDPVTDSDRAWLAAQNRGDEASSPVAKPAPTPVPPPAAAASKPAAPKPAPKAEASAAAPKPTASRDHLQMVEGRHYAEYLEAMDRTYPGLLEHVEALGEQRGWPGDLQLWSAGMRTVAYGVAGKFMVTSAAQKKAAAGAEEVARIAKAVAHAKAHPYVPTSSPADWAPSTASMVGHYTGD